MSSLIFYTQEDAAVVVTDTLAVSADDSGNLRPAFFTSKALYIPHLRMIIAGTGIGSVLDRWFLKINTSMLVSGVEQLDTHTPRNLALIWDEIQAELGALDGKTTTIYHFGISEDAGQITSFAYRSANRFESEPIGYGCGTKPACSVPEGNFLEHIETVMLEQQRSEEQRPAKERLHIGGHGVAIMLTAKECVHWCALEFPNFREQAEEAYRRLHR
jgi:hypothetical protein